MKTIVRVISLALFAASGLFATAASAGPAWDGGYLGLNIGGTFAQSSSVTHTVFSPIGYFASSSVPAIDAVGNQHASEASLSGGVEGGWNWRDDNWVVGLELDATIMGETATSSGSHTYPCCAPTAFNITSTIKQNWMLTARPRVGYVLGADDELVYITGGGGVTEEKVGFVFTDTFANAHDAGFRTTQRAGWVLGAGVAYPFGGGWSAKAEYLHTEFGNANDPGGTLTAFTPPISFPSNVFVHTASLHENIVRIGLDYQFD
jgi:outer membrane immunogenic protein